MWVFAVVLSDLYYLSAEYKRSKCENCIKRACNLRYNTHWQHGNGLWGILGGTYPKRLDKGSSGQTRWQIDSHHFRNCYLRIINGGQYRLKKDKEKKILMGWTSSHISRFTPYPPFITHTWFGTTTSSSENKSSRGSAPPYISGATSTCINQKTRHEEERLKKANVTCDTKYVNFPARTGSPLKSSSFPS